MTTDKIKFKKCTFRTKLFDGWETVNGYSYGNVFVYNQRQINERTTWCLISPAHGMSAIRTKTLRDMKMLAPLVEPMWDDGGTITAANLDALTEYVNKHDLHDAWSHKTHKLPETPAARRDTIDEPKEDTPPNDAPMTTNKIKLKRCTFQTAMKSGYVDVNGYSYGNIYIYNLSQTTTRKDWALISPQHGLSVVSTKTLRDMKMLAPLIEPAWDEGGTITAANLGAVRDYIKENNLRPVWCAKHRELPATPVVRRDHADEPKEETTPNEAPIKPAYTQDGVDFYALAELRRLGCPSLYASDYKLVGDKVDPLHPHRHQLGRSSTISLQGLRLAIHTNKGTPKTRATLVDLVDTITAQQAPPPSPIEKAMTKMAKVTSAIQKAAPKAARRAIETINKNPRDIKKTYRPYPFDRTTIEWQTFVSTHDDITGISLRAMVNAGLYSEYRHAAHAVTSTMDSSFFVVITKTQEGPGRPSQDILFTNLRTAQRFAARTRTAVGEFILDVILDHHDEFQAMLTGEARTPSDSLDVMRGVIDQLIEQRDNLKALNSQMDDLKRSLDDFNNKFGEMTPAEDMTASQVAQQGGWESMSHRWHNAAIISVGRHLGLLEKGLMYRIKVPVNEADEVRMGHKHFIKPDGAANILRYIDSNVTQPAPDINAYVLKVGGIDWALRRRKT